MPRWGLRGGREPLGRTELSQRWPGRLRKPCFAITPRQGLLEETLKWPVGTRISPVEPLRGNCVLRAGSAQLQAAAPPRSLCLFFLRFWDEKCARLGGGGCDGVGGWGTQKYHLC